MRLQKLLVVAQVTLSLMLIAAAGLFLQTFSALHNLETGFEMDPLLVVSVDAQRSAVKPEDRARFFERLRQAAASAPGVESAAASVITPVSGMAWTTLIEQAPGSNLPENSRVVWLNFVTPGWLSVMGTPMLAGRDLDARDKAGSPATAVVNEAFAKRFIGEENPLGRTFQQVGRPGEPQPHVEIVGLATNAVYRSLRAEIPPTAYIPLAQAEEVPPFVQITVRTAGPDPASLGKSVAAAIAREDGNLSLTFRPLSVQVLSSLSQERLAALLSTFFGVVGLLMAGLGLYGVTSYAVNGRRFEIGVRMALGAAPRGVVAMVLRSVAAQVGIGFILGLGAGLWASRFAETLLFGLQPHDPATFAGSAVLLLAVGLAAGWLPARRASRIDPARVLREV